MSFSPAFFDHLAEQGDGLHARVLTRDDAHLQPERLGRGAAARLRAGIAALESWLRRVLILMALTLEPDLQPSARPWVKSHRPRLSLPRPGLRILRHERDIGRNTFDHLAGRRRAGPSGRPVRAGPLLARLAALKALIDAPEARARRLALYLARRRPGRLRAPDPLRRLTTARYGTEASALFDAMGAAIWERSRARPPPIGPAIRAAPRIRTL